MTTDEQALVILRARLAKGQCLRQIAGQTGISYIRLTRLAQANRLHYPNKYTSGYQQRKAIVAVERRNLGFRAAAKRTGLARSTVHRIVQKRRNAIADTGGKTVAPKKVKPYRCPQHGLTTFQPCVMCAAVA